ncbi:MAG: LysE family translocator [Gammaproteobacteria bacterium]|nr:LysE family translocator [Gammaproteobacteria bacterium]
MSIQQFLIYISVSFFYIISPGPAVLLSINYGAVYGLNKTAYMLLGNSTGQMTLAFFSSLGIGLAVIKSYLLLNIIKIIGVIVLFYMGTKMLLAAYTDRIRITNICSSSELTKKNNFKERSFLSLYKEGYVMAITNPKPLIFFVSIYPQFWGTNKNEIVQLIILGCSFATISFICMNVYSMFGKFLSEKLLSNNGVVILNIISGVAFILISFTLLFSNLVQIEI